MKTLTEFSAFALREALAKSKEIRASLQTEGKPEEELATAHQETFHAFLKEKFRIEGEKLDLFIKALEVAEMKPREWENLKRIVVYTLTEGEKAPGHVVQRETHAFAAEYLASLRPQKNDRRESGSKHGKGDGKGKRRGKRRGDLKGKRPDGQTERRGANPGASDRNAQARPGAPGSEGARSEKGRPPRRDGRTGRPRPPRGEIAPGHLSVEQAAQAAAKSTGIRPIEKP
ncbi:MAG: hypothetical protein RJB38_392 [Pseudomonadota bacterium]|jgi:hypothetical protein